MASAAKLSRDEKVALVEKLEAELIEVSEPSEWEAQLAQERLRLFEQGLSVPIPWEEAKARLKQKWGKK